LFSGKLPPTLITSLWHGGFSARRNPFALCYYGRRYSSLGVSDSTKLVEARRIRNPREFN